jgi:hypothetical protein
MFFVVFQAFDHELLSEFGRPWYPFDVIFSVVKALDCPNIDLRTNQRFVAPMFDEKQQIVFWLLDFVTLIVIVPKVIASRATGEESIWVGFEAVA